MCYALEDLSPRKETNHNNLASCTDVSHVFRICVMFCIVFDKVGSWWWLVIIHKVLKCISSVHLDLYLCQICAKQHKFTFVVWFNGVWCMVYFSMLGGRFDCWSVSPSSLVNYFVTLFFLVELISSVLMRSGHGE